MTGTSCRALLTALLLMLGLMAAGAGADALPPAGGKPHLAIRLVAESEHPRSGATVTLALATTPEAGWHGYWRNPGDAGFPGDYKWTLPAGVRAGALQWPVPTTLMVAGLMNYVYEAPYAPLVEIAVPGGLAAGTRLPIRLEADYLVCTQTLCVPEKQALSLDLTVGDGAPGPQTAAFAGWRRAIPKPLDAPAQVQAANGTVRIAVPFPAGAALAQPYFFPVTTGAIDYAAPQAVSRDGDRLIVATKGKGAAGAIEGVLRIGAGQGLAIRAVPGSVADAGRGAGGGTGGESRWGWTALVAFAGAVLGGLILNIMPCVFPILSLKALSLARGGESEAGARAEALAYTAGVVLVCVGLGAAILGLRAGGSAVGWAFQLQDPRAIVVLLLLSVAIALNLAGLFEVPTPRFAGEGGSAGAFATGALAAFVATPCTGPFMGAALGAALVLPAAAALAVFAGLGLGLALPFLALGFVPALRRRLPRPGGWMETFRRVLSVPMWLTAIALAWVLGRQAGVDGMAAALVAGLTAALLLWLGGLRQRRGLSFGWGYLVALVAVAAFSSGTIARSAARPAVAQAAGTEPFSETRLAALRAQGRPVFAYFTADWCLTCKVNERSSIDTDRVHRAFVAKKVAVLEGDWTDGDAKLGAFIQAHNRAGVPLYLFYPAGGGEPQVLPQVLTPAMLEALS
jgi:thiol:disulfide interchange protein